MKTFARRLARAATLDPNFYDECVENRRLVWPALLVVVAGGAAGILAQYIGRDFEVDAMLEKLMRGTLIWTLSWPVLAGVAFAVGRWILGGEGSFDGVLRGMGWAFTPGLLQIAIAFPPLQFVAFAVPMVWMIATSMAATGSTLRISSSRAMIATLLAWGVWGIVGVVLQIIQGTLPSFTT